MKKLSALILALALLVSVIPAAYAANATPNTTTLTTTVPSATYVLNIPADQEIPFGQEVTKIGNITITDGKNFASGKNVKVTTSYEPFSAENVSTTIPYQLDGGGISDGKGYSISVDSLTFYGNSDGTVAEKVTWACNPLVVGQACKMEYVRVHIQSSAWGKALQGVYKSTITFTSEVVVE